MVFSQKTRRREPDAKHSALLEAAIVAFCENGYSGTSMADIAKRASVSVGTIYRFYPDKISLLSALHDIIEADLIKAMKASWDKGGDYASRLDRMITRLFDFFEARRPVLSILSMTTDLGQPDGTLPADGIRNVIASFLAEGSEAGAYVAERPEFLAALVHGTVEGMMRQYLTNRASKEDAISTTRDFVRRAMVVPERT